MDRLARQHQVVRQVQLHLEIGMRRLELRQQRSEVAPSEAERAMHLQLAGHRLAALPQRLLDGLHVFEHAGGVLRQQMALVGQLQPARGAQRKPDAQARFELAEPLGHGRRRHVFLARQRREAAEPVQRQHEAQVVNGQLHHSSAS